jgi:hypothetical protein
LPCRLYRPPFTLRYARSLGSRWRLASWLGHAPCRSPLSIRPPRRSVRSHAFAWCGPLSPLSDSPRPRCRAPLHVPFGVPHCCSGPPFSGGLPLHPSPPRRSAPDHHTKRASTPTRSSSISNLRGGSPIRGHRFERTLLAPENSPSIFLSLAVSECANLELAT